MNITKGTDVKEVQATTLSVFQYQADFASHCIEIHSRIVYC